MVASPRARARGPAPASRSARPPRPPLPRRPRGPARLAPWLAGWLAALALTAASLARAGPVFLGSRGEIRVVIPRVERGPVVDGVLDDPVWAQAAVLDSFVMRDPVDGVRDTLGTRCLLLYDGREIFIGFRCLDRPGLVRAPLVPRDKADEGDYVAVGFDTYHDFQRALIFAASPRGVQLDGVDTDADGFDSAPDFQYRSAGRLTATGYEVEMAVPFRSLRFPARDTVTFGFNAGRSVVRDGAFLYWAPISRNRASNHAQWGEITGLHDVHPGRNLDVVPGFTVQRSGEARDGRLAFGDPATRASLDLRGAVGTGFTANATVNPDFSQVEADAEVVDINQRFAIFYPEKRPFFLEGSDLFATPISAFYSRRIVEPRYGIKLTGHSGNLAVGALRALDRGAGGPTPKLPDALNPYLDQDAATDIVRVRRELGRGSSVGVLAVHREQRETYDRLGALDARLVFREHWRLVGQVLGSATRDRDYRGAVSRLTPAEAAAADSTLALQTGARHTGHAFTVTASRETRRLDTGAWLDDYSRHFDVATGFVQRVGVVDAGVWVQPQWFASGASWFTSIAPELSFSRTFEHGGPRWAGRRTDENADAELHLAMPQSTSVDLEVGRRYTLFGGRDFPDQIHTSITASTSRWRLVEFGGTIGTGDAVIFEEVAAGRSADYSLFANLRPTPPLKITLNLDGSVVTRKADDTRFADAVIPRVRADYQFTRELSMRAIGQLRAERHYDASGRPTSDQHVTLDWLAAYLLRPGSVVYLGYGSGLEGASTAAARPIASSLFFKVSWLFED
jgi:hypothetical protein